MGGKKRILFATVASAALLGPLGVFGGSSFAHGFASAWQYGHGSGGSQYQYGKVTICHHTHSRHHPFVTITVSAHAAAHLIKHGDTVGACPGTTPPPARHHDDDGNGGDEQGEHNGNHGNHHGDHGDHGSVVISTSTTPMTTTTTTTSTTSGEGDGGNGHGDSHGGGEHGGHGH